MGKKTSKKKVALNQGRGLRLLKVSTTHFNSDCGKQRDKKKESKLAREGEQKWPKESSSGKLFFLELWK